MNISIRLLLVILLAPIVAGCASAPPPDPDAYPNQEWTTHHRPQGSLMWLSSRFNDISFRPDAGALIVNFNPNSCTLNQYGETGACTMMTTIMLNMEPTLADKRQTKDGSTERLFTLDAEGAPNMALVFKTPPGADSPTHARLIGTNDDGGVTTIINLHRVQEGAPAEIPPEPSETINQRWHTGYRLWLESIP